MFLLTFVGVDVWDWLGEMAGQDLSQEGSVVEGMCIDDVALIPVVLEERLFYVCQSALLLALLPPCGSAFGINAIVLNIDQTYEALNSVRAQPNRHQFPKYLG